MKIPWFYLSSHFLAPENPFAPKNPLFGGSNPSRVKFQCFSTSPPARKSKFKKKNHVPCCLNPPIKNTCASSCLFKTRKKKKKKRTVTFQKCCPYLSLFPVQLPIFIPNVCKNQPPTQKKTHTLDSHFLTIFL